MTLRKIDPPVEVPYKFSKHLKTNSTVEEKRQSLISSPFRATTIEMCPKDKDGEGDSSDDQEIDLDFVIKNMSSMELEKAGIKDLDRKLQK